MGGCERTSRCAEPLRAKTEERAHGRTKQEDEKETAEKRNTEAPKRPAEDDSTKNTEEQSKFLESEPEIEHAEMKEQAGSDPPLVRSLKIRIHHSI